MTGKSRNLYDAVLFQIRCIAPSFKPKLSVTDFEQALYSSVKFTFDCEIQGCYFHFRQSLFDKNHSIEGNQSAQAEEIENEENDEMMNSISPDESPDEFNFGLDCEEMELTDFTFCSFCETQKIEFCATPCGHMLCTLCIEQQSCLKCHLSIVSRFAIFFRCLITVS